MTDVRLKSSAIDSNSSTIKKIKQLPSKKLLNNYQRNPPISSNATLSITSLPSFSTLKQKIIQMPTNKKSPIPSNNTPIDFRMAHIKSPTRNINRLNLSPTPKLSPNGPITSPRPNNQRVNNRYLYLVNTVVSYHRTISARIPHNNQIQASLPEQQAIPLRPYSQYGHFLAYLRRQSLARTRRKQEEEEGNIDHVETKITLNLNKQSLKSASNNSITVLTNNSSSSKPTITMTTKGSGRVSSSYQPLQRSATSYRLNAFRQPLSSSTTKNSFDEQLVALSSSSLLITPRNSMADDISAPPMKRPYELYLNDDNLKDNRIIFQRQIISSSV